MQNQTLITATTKTPVQRYRYRNAYSDYSATSMIVGGLFVFCFYTLMSYATMYSFPWQDAMGSARGKVDVVKPGYKLKQDVSYSYVVDSKNYSAHESFQFHGFFMKSGDEVLVRFDKTRPEFAFIQSGFTLATILYALMSLAGIPFIFAGLSLACGQKRRPLQLV